jgi:hypothetical protein
MKIIHKAIVRNLAGAALILAFLAATAPSADAGHRAGKPAVQPAPVIAHLPLGGASVSQMFVREQGGIQYLYLGQTSKDGVAIVDVTKPNQPSMVKRLAWPNEASNGKFQILGGGLALAKAPDTAEVEAASRTENLMVLDLSDPANPRTIRSFSGVTSTLADDSRNLLYIANSEGLWILKHRPEQATSSEPRGCLSGDALHEIANCQ